MSCIASADYMSGSGRCTCPNEAVPLSLNTLTTAACIGFVPRSSRGLCLSVLTIKTSAISGTTEVELILEDCVMFFTHSPIHPTPHSKQIQLPIGLTKDGSLSNTPIDGVLIRTLPIDDRSHGSFLMSALYSGCMKPLFQREAVSLGGNYTSAVDSKNDTLKRLHISCRVKAE
uniref:Uncharacterized protein n=1 Tax=Magallana gigas TaxID=29159 RepID=K1QX95_MAGGI